MRAVAKRLFLYTNQEVSLQARVSKDISAKKYKSCWVRYVTQGAKPYSELKTERTMQWYVLYTKSRCEQKTAQLLSRQGMEVYCPVQISVRQWSDRKKTIEEPIFKSYVFVRMADYNKEHIRVLMTPGAVRFLWWMQKPGIVKDHEIDAIKTFLANHKDISLKSVDEEEVTDEDAWSPGQQIRITSGVLKGQEATLVRVINNKARLKLPSLGWELVAEIPVAQIEKN